jgi:hypothetical protein
VNIEWATLCVSAESAATGFNIQGATLELALVPELPGRFTGALAVKTGGINDFPSFERLSIKIFSPSGKTVLDMSDGVVVEFPEGVNYPTDLNLHHGFVAQLSWTLEEYGAYRIEVSFSDGSIYEVALTVIDAF